MAKKGIVRVLFAKALGGIEFVLSTSKEIVAYLKDTVDGCSSSTTLGQEFKELAKSWQQFYREIFGLEIDLSASDGKNSGVLVYNYNDYLVFVPKKLNTSWIVEAFKYHFGNLHIEEEVGDLKKLQSVERAFDGEYYVKIITDQSLTSLSEFEDYAVSLDERLLLDMYSRWAKKEPLLPDGSSTFCDATQAIDGRVVEVISDMDGLTIALEAPLVDYSEEPLQYGADRNL